jgi:hypothetical protein
MLIYFHSKLGDKLDVAQEKPFDFRLHFRELEVGRVRQVKNDRLVKLLDLGLVLETVRQSVCHDFSLLHDFGVFGQHSHVSVLPHRVVNRFKHARLIEFEVAFIVEDLRKPLDLPVDCSLIMVLLYIVEGAKEQESEPVGFDVRQNQVVEEGVCLLNRVLLQVHLYQLLCMVDLHEASLLQEAQDSHKVRFGLHRVFDYEFFRKKVPKKHAFFKNRIEFNPLLEFFERTESQD